MFAVNVGFGLGDTPSREDVVSVPRTPGGESETGVSAEAEVTRRKSRMPEAHDPRPSTQFLKLPGSDDIFIEVNTAQVRHAPSFLVPRISKPETHGSSSFGSIEELSRSFTDLFELPEDEVVHEEFECSIFRLMLVSGCLYLSKNYLCFYADVFGQADEQGAIYEGYCDKMSRTLQRWNRRYFVLQKDKIQYYKNPGEQYNVRGTIPLTEVLRVDDQVPTYVTTKSHPFRVVTKTKTYYMNCESRQMMEEWINNIRLRQFAHVHGEDEIKLVIPLRGVSGIEHHESAAVFPNSVSIMMDDGQDFFFCGLENNTGFVEEVRSPWNAARLSNESRRASIAANEPDAVRVPSSAYELHRKELPFLDELTLEEKAPEISQESEVHKRTTEFAQIFGSIPATEKLLATFPVALQRAVHVKGRLYVSSTGLHFYSKILKVKTRLSLQFCDIEGIEKSDVALLFPAAISVITKDNKSFLFSMLFKHRNTCYSQLMNGLLQKRLGSTNTKSSAPKALKSQESGLSKASGKSTTSVKKYCVDEDADVYSTKTVLQKNAKRSLLFTICVVGSRGDVQPFVALAQGLKAEGHRVRIATHETFRNFVGEYGFEFVPIAGDPRELMDLCVSNGMFTYKFIKEAMGKFRSFIDELLESVYEACKGTDVIIENPPAMAGYHVAEKLQVPLFVAFTMPFSRTRAFPNPFAVTSKKMGGHFNYMSYMFIEQAFFQPIRNQFNKFRTETLGLPPIPVGMGGSSLLHDKRVPHLYCFSPSIIPQPEDWPETYIHVTGYWFLDAPITWKPPEALVEFLKAAPPPIYIGFGSITLDDPDMMTRTIVEALKLSGQRGIVSKGWGGVAPLEENGTIYQLDSVPHDWLFPQMLACCHHGGAGTTAAGIRAGIPTIIVPFFGDQYFWGRQVEVMGLGPEPIPQAKLTVEKLAAAFKTVSTDQAMQIRCKEAGEQIRSENGIQVAVDKITSHLPKFDFSNNNLALPTSRPRGKTCAVDGCSEKRVGGARPYCERCLKDVLGTVSTVDDRPRRDSTVAESPDLQSPNASKIRAVSLAAPLKDNYFPAPEVTDTTEDENSKVEAKSRPASASVATGMRKALGTVGKADSARRVTVGPVEAVSGVSKVPFHMQCMIESCPEARMKGSRKCQHHNDEDVHSKDASSATPNE